MFVKVNDVNLYYKKKGKGNPIILLHGNGEDNRIFDVLINKLCEDYTVYAVDTRNHGKSEKGKELNYKLMCEDIKCFIEKLKIERPLVCGFSDGGIVGILLASRYPNLLSKLIICGANINPKGIKNRYQVIFKSWYLFTKNSKVKMMINEPNILTSELKKINIPVLVLAGSNDVIKEEHTMHIANNINNSILKIIKGESHDSYVINSPKLFKLIKPFLNSGE